MKRPPKVELIPCVLCEQEGVSEGVPRERYIEHVAEHERQRYTD